MRSINKERLKKSLFELYDRIKYTNYLSYYYVTILRRISKVFYDIEDSRIFAIYLSEKILKELVLKETDQVVIEFYNSAINAMKKYIDIYKAEEPEITELRENIYSYNIVGTKRVNVNASRVKFKSIELEILDDLLIFFCLKYYSHSNHAISEMGRYWAGYDALKYYLIDYDIYYKECIFRFKNESQDKLIEIINYWSNYYFKKTVDELLYDI